MASLQLRVTKPAHKWSKAAPRSDRFWPRIRGDRTTRPPCNESPPTFLPFAQLFNENEVEIDAAKSRSIVALLTRELSHESESLLSLGMIPNEEKILFFNPFNLKKNTVVRASVNTLFTIFTNGKF